MTLGVAAAFLPFALVTAFTPGPNNVMLAASGANFGLRRTLPHILGVIAGFPLLVLGVGLGLGTLFQRYPVLHATLKFAGAAFLLFLAWRVATAGHEETEAVSARPLTFVEAALFQWVNPKAWVFAVTAIATYTNVGGRLPLELMAILAVCTLVSVGSTVAWTVSGLAVRRFLQGSRRRLRTFNLTMALLLVLSIVPVMI